MAFNKNKVIALAQKYVQKGQIDRAIKEYQKVLEVDKKDIRTKLKVGDLFAKKGDTQGAARIYQEVAESYSRDGFYLKAVAVYKNILKLAPNLIEVNLKLGDLYHQLSLLGDAMSQYQIVVNYYDRHGMVKESLDTLKKMVELDPENITFRINLAELYHKEGHAKQGLQELENLANELKETGNQEDLVKVYERIVHHHPDRDDLLKDLSDTYLQLQQPQRALAKLQIAFKKNPKDTETLELLAKAFLVLQQPKKAKSVYKELLTLYDEAGDNPNRARVSDEILKISPEDREASAYSTPKPKPGEKAPSVPASNMPSEVTQYDEEVTEFSIHTAGSLLDPVAEVAPGQTSAPPSISSPDEEPVMDLSPEEIEGDDFEDIEEEINKLLTETEVYLKYGLNDKAKEHLEIVLQKSPKHLEARKKLKEMYQNLGDKPKVIEQLKQLIQIAEENNDSAAQNAFQKELRDLDSSSAKKPKAKDPLPSAPPAQDEEILDLESDGQPFDLEEEMAMASQEGDLEISPESVSVKLDLDDGASNMVEQVTKEEIAHEEKELELPDSALESVEMDLGIEVDIAEPEEEAPSLDIMEDAGESEPVPQPEPIAMKSSKDEIPLEVREELDEAEFFIQQGLEDEAQKIFDDLLQRFPNHSLVQTEVKNKLSQVSKEDSQSPALDLSDVPLEDPIATAPDPKPIAISQGPDDEGFDLASELAEELDGYEEAPAEEPSTDEQVDFNEVFEEFKKGVSKQIGKEDSETHFDLGLAYKEMNLIEDAISEFKIAMGNAQKTIECLTMIGLCLMDKGDFSTAEKYFQKGLGTKSINSQETVGLSYELGVAQMASGKKSDAIKTFTQVYNLDPNFRDIATLLKDIKQGQGGHLDTTVSEDEGFDLGESLGIEDQLTELSAFDTPTEKGKPKGSLSQGQMKGQVKGQMKGMTPSDKPKSSKSKNKISYI